MGACGSAVRRAEPRVRAGGQDEEIWKGAEREGTLRRVAWQRITERLGGRLQYHAEGTAEKHGRSKENC